MNRICAGISRASRFSPNRESNDNAVFSQVAEYLRENGWDVRLYSEAEFIDQTQDEQYIFHMAREESTIDRLEKLEQACAVVVNPARSIKNCRRDILTSLLLEGGIPYPRSFTAETSCAIEELMQKNGMSACWLKRADMHTLHPYDVCFAPTTDIARKHWTAFALRGIERVVVNEHLSGDLIKFYGVTDEPFFFWCYPRQGGCDKFGHERINGTPAQYPFKETDLQELCTQAARQLGVCIYGGDAIVSPDGSIHIIDLNDWPSFSPCLHEAVTHIGRAIIKKFNR